MKRAAKIMVGILAGEIILACALVHYASTSWELPDQQAALEVDDMPRT